MDGLAGAKRPQLLQDAAARDARSGRTPLTGGVVFGAFSRYDERFHLAQSAGILHTDHDLESGAVYVNAVDMLFVGRFTGTESLAAVSVCGPILNVMIITLSGMSAGVLVVISGLLGAGDIKQAQDAAHTSVALYALMAAVMTVLGLLFGAAILRLVRLRPPRCRRQSGTCIRCLREPCSPLDIT